MAYQDTCLDCKHFRKSSNDHCKKCAKWGKKTSKKVI